MKLSNTVVTTLFAIQALATGVLCDEPTSLRRSSVESPKARRNLFGSLTFAQIAGAFQPLLAVAMEAALSAGADPLHLGVHFSLDVESVIFDEECTSSATVTFTVHELSGLGGFVLDNMPVVDGSQSLNLNFFRGTTWEADFSVEGSFPKGLEAVVDVEIIADACGVAVQESVSGVINAVDAGAALVVSTSGSAPGIFSLNSASAKVDVSGNAEVELGALSTAMEFGNGIDVDLAEIIASVLETPEFVEQIAGAIVDILRRALNGITISF